jgi:hypothetical protein
MAVGDAGVKMRGRGKGGFFGLWGAVEPVLQDAPPEGGAVAERLRGKLVMNFLRLGS